MIDGFALPVVHHSDPMFPELSRTDRVSGNPFPESFLDFWNSNTNHRDRLSSSDFTASVEPPFVDTSSTLPSTSDLTPELRDLTNWNVVSPPETNNNFESLLTAENTDALTKLPIVEENNPSLRSHEARANTSSSQPIPAFPGAEGFGARSVGGRGGRVIEVTNLHDSGLGSLRAALEAEGPRIVVFRVAGTIRLQDTIDIKNPYLTVAGQTAPGGGILLRGSDSTLIRIEEGAHDIIIRYLRLRNGSGDTEGDRSDNISINGGHDIIIDHVSMSWSTDENASIWNRPGNQPIYNVTIQNSILAEGFKGHSKGLLIGGQTDFSDPNQPVEAWKDVKRISIHHNLFAHNSNRNPRVTSSKVHVINNVMYNWDGRIGETTRGAVVDYINNYAKAGPVSHLENLFFHENFDPFNPNEPYPDPSIYTQGNIVDPVQTDPNADNWDLWKLNFTYEPIPQSYRRSNPLQPAQIPVNIQSAHDAYQSVLSDVGANARLDCSGDWVSNADSVDVRILRDVRHGTGTNKPISYPGQVGGYPELHPGRLCRDNDGDGMTNVWEHQHGLNHNDPTDGSADRDGDGYTNVEEYLHGQLLGH